MDPILDWNNPPLLDPDTDVCGTGERNERREQ